MHVGGVARRQRIQKWRKGNCPLGLVPGKSCSKAEFEGDDLGDGKREASEERMQRSKWIDPRNESRQD